MLPFRVLAGFRFFPVKSIFNIFFEKHSGTQTVAGVSGFALMTATRKLALLGKNDFEYLASHMCSIPFHVVMAATLLIHILYK